MKSGKTWNETGRDPINSINSVKRAFLDSSFPRGESEAHQFHQFRQTGLSGHFSQRGESEAPSIASIPSNWPFWTISLSLGRVFASHSALATGLVSRHWPEFGTSQACQFCNVQAGAQAIFGAKKCLQRASRRLLKGPTKARYGPTRGPPGSLN